MAAILDFFQRGGMGILVKIFKVSKSFIVLLATI